MDKKEVYFVQVDGEENLYAGDNLKDCMEFIEPYIAELSQLGETIEIVVSKQEMTQAEIDALPEY